MNPKLKSLYSLSITFLLLSAILPDSISQTKSYGIITIKNPSQKSRKLELVSVPYGKLISKLPQSAKVSFKLINTTNNSEIPFQLEYRGGSKPVNLLIQISCAANATVSIAIKEGKPSVIPQKTFARYVPERYDDFAWENDRVAFRMYGPALEARNDNGYGIDVWSKRTSSLIIDKWYKIDNYHRDNGEGVDYYQVGRTLGAGDIAPYVNDSIYYTNNYKSWKILDKGPLRSTFQLSYATRNVAGIPVTVTKTISLDAGSQMNRIEAVFDFQGLNDLPVAIGIVKRAMNGAILLNEKDKIIAYWEPEDPVNGIMGLGCILLPVVKEMKTEKGHLLAVSSIKTQLPLVYYSGAAWNKAGIIKNSQDWFTYLSDFSYRIKNPLEITVK